MANPDSETPAARRRPKRVAQPACERRPSSVSAADPKAIHGTGHQGSERWEKTFFGLLKSPF